MSFREILAAAAAHQGIELTGEQLAAFQRYYQILSDWNSRVNITAITEPHEVAVKHMLDSLTVLDPAKFPAACSVVDIGSGGGFPGLPLKIVRPDLKLTLLDSQNKRINFLTAVVDELGLPAVTVVHCRAEEGARQARFREKFSVAVARAVARLNVLCELCLPYVALGGWFVALKGDKYEEEVREAEAAIRRLGGKLNGVKQVSFPGYADNRAIIYLNKVKPTPSAYPRRPGIPEKKPL